MKLGVAPLLALVAAVAAVAGARAQETCAVPEHLTHVEGKLPRVALMAKDAKLDILVEGTGSSTLTGPEGARAAYPARLEAALASRLPGVTVSVRTDVKSRRTTAEMAKALAGLAPAAQPGLVIWQTGTIDAMRGVDPDEFREALEKGVRKLQAVGIDVLLVNMQYSPRTETMITIEPYAEAMRWVAQQTDVPLFDRFAVMRHWSETGAFDLSGSNGLQVAERVHDCLGKLLAELILDAAGIATGQTKDSR
ncbi:MAG TPA: GDSL-type esterase/lipase family protein [Xanthobacteraceae bacterium]|nr:GDSL-type esterase/lipase family protein [Xanthobacteraceae bacterium]